MGIVCYAFYTQAQGDDDPYFTAKKPFEQLAGRLHSGLRHFTLSMNSKGMHTGLKLTLSCFETFDFCVLPS